MSEAFGFQNAVPIAAFSELVIVTGLILLGIGTPPARRDYTPLLMVTGKLSDSREVVDSQWEALRQWHFWSVALPFALALAPLVFGLLLDLSGSYVV